MTAMTHDDLVTQVAMIWEQAAAAGERPPGRPTLREMTGASDHQIKKAIARLSAPPTPPVIYTGDDVAEPLAMLAPEIHQTRQLNTPPGDSGGRWPMAWPLVLIGIAAAVAVWSGWVGLGELTGFGPVNLLPGIGHGWTINSAIVLPLSVEAYGGYAMRVWLSAAPLSDRTRAFARTSSITSLAVGMAAQIAYHLMVAAGVHHAPWPITTMVASVAVILVGLAAALARLVTNDRQPHQ